jgi:hypothetical protein
VKAIVRASEASEPHERSGALGVPASECVGGSGGAKPPGMKLKGHASYRIAPNEGFTLYVELPA